MAATNLARGDDTIGFSYVNPATPSLPPPIPAPPTQAPFAAAPDSIIAQLIQKAADLEVLVEGKVGKDEIKTQIAFGSELVKIQAAEVAVVGDFTVIDIVNEQRGVTTGQLDTTITRIIGDLIQTGAIISNNFSTLLGTQIDLDNATIIMGGSAAPKFDFDGTDLTIEGTITTGSLFSGDINTSGSIFADGSTTEAGLTATIVVIPTSSSVDGIAAFIDTADAGTVAIDGGVNITTDGIAIFGHAGGTDSIGVAGTNGSSAGAAVSAFNSAGGTALLLNSDVIEGDATFEDDVDIEGILSLTEQTAPADTVGKCHLYAATDSDGHACLGIRPESDIESDTFTPVPNRRIEIVVDDVECWLYLELRT